MASKNRKSRSSRRSSRHGNMRVPKFVPGTRVAFGKERTPAQCRARAAWERTQARALKDSFGGTLAAGHLKTAEDYDWLARKREKDPVGPQRARRR